MPEWIKVCELLLSYNLLASLKIANQPSGTIESVVSKLESFQKSEYGKSKEKKENMKQRVLAYAAVVTKDYYQIQRSDDFWKKTDKICEAFTKKKSDSVLSAREILKILYPSDENLLEGL